MPNVSRNRGLSAKDVAELLAYAIDANPWPLSAEGAVTVSDSSRTAAFEIVSNGGSRFQATVMQSTEGRTE